MLCHLTNTKSHHDFSPEKIEEFQAAFNYFDKDSSGSISKEEYVNRVKML
jgi:Ca2+-binding EF-hand superfamily protein